MERPPTLSEAIEEFLQDLRLAGRAGPTVASYAAMLPRVLAGLERVSELDERAVKARLLAHYDRLSASTRLLYYKQLAAFCAWLVRRGYLPRSPMERVPRPPDPPRRSRALSPEELRRVWELARPRQRLVLALLLEGLRISEVCALTWDDVLLDDGVIRVRSAKGRPPRLIAISPAIREALQWAGRPRLVPVAPAAVRRWLRPLGRRAGIKGGLYPHRFRHTWATEWLLAGGPEGALQVLGGWSTPRMIRQVYAAGAVERAAVQEARRLGLSERLLGD